MALNRSFENIPLFIEEIANEIIDSSINSAENTVANATSVSENRDRNIVDDESLQGQKTDIGLLPEHISINQIEEIVSIGPPPKPSFVPPDSTGNVFPFSVFEKKRSNGEFKIEIGLFIVKRRVLCFAFSADYLGKKFLIIQVLPS